MRTNDIFLSIIFFVIGITNCSIAQQTTPSVRPESLENLSYRELAIRFHKNRQNLKETEAIAKTYLQKGKLEKSESRIAQGYHFMSFINDKNSLELSYLDSAIYITKKLKNSDYPAMSYVMRGDYFFKKRNFKRALDDYTLGSKFARASNVEELEYRIKFNIGVLKTRLGDFKESIAIFNYCKNYYLKGNDIENYLLSLFALSDANVRLKKYAAATLINKKGYATAFTKKNKRMLDYFTLEEGVNQYWQHNYQASKDSIIKVLPSLKAINDMPNLAMGYYYLGMNHYETGSIAQAIDCFKKVDTVFKDLNDLHPDTRKGYELLINHYKEKGDIKNQLYFIEQLMKLDAVLNTNYKYLSRKIDVEYDTPQLISEKEKVIAQLTKKEHFSTFKISGLSLLIFVLSGITFYSFKKQKRYKKNFENLLVTLESKEKTSEEAEIFDDEKPVCQSPSSLDIQPHIVEDIEKKLKQFEKDLGFLSKDCTLNKVAEHFETNTNYLSKIVNARKGVGFSVYINELRIDYAIIELQKNRQFRSYTIKAIAETVGFNTAETFSKAFFAKTGIQPSYFVKELKNKGL